MPYLVGIIQRKSVDRVFPAFSVWPYPRTSPPVETACTLTLSIGSPADVATRPRWWRLPGVTSEAVDHWKDESG